MAATENVQIPDELISSLQNQVSDLSFVDSSYKLKGYSCCACRNIAISHCIANCEDVFCTKCYAKYYNKPCPDCKTRIESNKHDSEFERAVLELQVKCKFSKNGCEEKVLLKNYLKHIISCKFSPERLLPRVYKGDSTHDVLKQLTDDVHKIKQSISLMKSENMKPETSNKSLDEKLPKMMKELADAISNMQIEMKSLKDSMTALQLENTGEMQNFECQQEHHLSELKTEVALLKHFREDYYGNDPPNIYFWKVPEFQKKLQAFMGEKPVTFTSETSFITHNGLKFSPQLYTEANCEFVNINIRFTTDINSSVPYLHSRKYAMLDQSEAVIKDDVVRIDRPSFKTYSAKDLLSNSFVASWFFPISLLKDKINKYIKNDQIIIKIILEPIDLLWKQIACNDGNLLLKINDYSKKNWIETNGMMYQLTSKPFKTTPTGYTMHVEVHLNGFGNGMGQFIAIFLRVILGEHDAFLSLPVKCKLKFCLLDQSDSLTKRNIIHERNSEFRQLFLMVGISEFVRKRIAENPIYLRNDSLLIQTTVQIL